ncbi:MAG: methionine gamma-lyase family protein [Clostridia bacterium]|nr:methionine gamma-lyase family protein [Clostridia bacterium]
MAFTSASSRARALVESAERDLTVVYERIHSVEYAVQERVLRAFSCEEISARHFAPTYGYGYDDIARDALDRVFAHSFECEDALVRPQLVSGTHAIFTALDGLLQAGNTLLSITGKPYDTLESAIGLSDGGARGSLIGKGVKYKQHELCDGSCMDVNALDMALCQDTSIKVVYIQRSRGYDWRDSIDLSQIAAVCAVVHSHPGVCVMLDNCYGEFTDFHEPTHYGVDIMAGSLIKNPGGGIAPTGGYVCGKHVLVELISNRLTVPGTGREVGSYAASYQPFYQGLFIAPHVTANALKSAALFARVFELLGMNTLPASNAVRSDIVQSVRFKDAASLIAFCRSIQAVSPVDSHVTPYPWDMPGYSDQVIMAAGAFVQGSSIELSADAPIREPYTAYVQGALTYGHGRIAVMAAVDALRANTGE